MSGLILPDSVLHAAELDRNLERLNRLRERGGWLQHFDQELKQIDPHLSLVKARETVTEPGLTPGYWHVKRDNPPPALPSYLPITDGEGGFVEPHMGVLEHLKAQDLQKPGALDRLRRARDEEERRRQQDRLLAQEQRVEEMAGRVKAIENPGVRFGGRGWTYRAGARRAA